MGDKNTEYLLQVLHTVNGREELGRYVEEQGGDRPQMSFCQYFTDLLAQKKLPKSEAVKNSQISRTYAYQILDGRKNPSRDKAVALCLSAGLDLKQTQRALTAAGVSPLYPKARRDAILIYAVNQQMGVLSANDLLYEMGEEVLA